MTEQQFAALRIGNVVAARPGDRYVISEVRNDGAIAVRTLRLASDEGWYTTRRPSSSDPLKNGLAGLAAGDLITQEHGLTHIVSANEGDGAVTVVITVKLWHPTDWALVG